MTMSMVPVVVGYLYFIFVLLQLSPINCPFAFIPRYINLYEAVLHYSFIS